MDYLTASYVIYGGAALLLTAVLARLLGRYGFVFLEEVFSEKEGMAEAVNKLLVIGFYMLNLGYALLLFRTDRIDTNLQVTENLVTRLGLLLLSLGVIHFVNMAVFFKIRNRMERSTVPPVRPGMLLPPPPQVAPHGGPNPFVVEGQQAGGFNNANAGQPINA